MSHKPIVLTNLELSFPHKTCFEAFNAEIHSGSRIALIGRNGSGKSTLLKMLPEHAPKEVTFGYVPQIVNAHTDLSGGERFQAALTEALSLHPDVLLLDEPTNHLDARNRKSLMRMLKNFNGTLVIVSHDVELLKNCIDTLWHINDGAIHIFSGNYDDYFREIQQKRLSIEQELAQLNRDKKESHEALMQEQSRAKNSREKGAKSIKERKWPTIVSDAKARRAEQTSGRKKSEIKQKKAILTERLSELRIPEIIKPKFLLTSENTGRKTVISITAGRVSYGSNVILDKIQFSLGNSEKIAITGDNGSGKSTFIKAILSSSEVTVSGQWQVPPLGDIGYLDQHYHTLNRDKTVLENIRDLLPKYSDTEVRLFLGDFLFRKNEEVYALASTLSGGEQARLSLAKIAAKPPKLLILDEITNNLDLETREHVIQILREYPGAMIVISHDDDFLEKIGVERKDAVALWHA